MDSPDGLHSISILRSLINKTDGDRHACDVGIASADCGIFVDMTMFSLTAWGIAIPSSRDVPSSISQPQNRQASSRLHGGPMTKR